MRKALVLLLLFFAFGLSLTTLPQVRDSIPETFAAGPTIVNSYADGNGSAAVAIMSHTITVTSGNTLVVLATQAVRAGSPTGITVTATNSINCQVAVNNHLHGAGDNQIEIVVCPVLTHGGSTIIQASSAGACGGGNPCGFMGLYIYEIQGAGFTIVNSTGNNAKASANPAVINSTSFTGPALILGADSVNTASTTQTVGAGFTLGPCFTSSVNSAVYACTETASSVATGSTTVPFNLNQVSSWADEAVILSGGGVTQPIRCSMFQVGPQANLTLSGGAPSPSFVICDGSTHNISVNVNATLALTEPSSSSTNRNVFAGAATVLTHVVCASGTCSLFSFTNYFQDNDTYNWTPPLACPGFCAAQKPKVTVSFIGASTTFNLQPSNGTILTTPKTAQWIDNNTAWTTTNPFFYNNAYWTPSPNGGTIRGSPTITITYSAMVPSNQTCTSHDPFTLFSKMCFVPGFIYSYGNILGVSNFLTIIWLIFASAIFLKSGSPILTVTFLLIGFAVFSGLAIGVGGSAASGISSTGWQIGLIALVLVLGGTVVRLFVGRNS